MNDDVIYRQKAIDLIMSQPPEPHYPSWYAEQIKSLPPAQQEKTVYIPETKAIPTVRKVKVKAYETLRRQ